MLLRTVIRVSRVLLNEVRGPTITVTYHENDFKNLRQKWDIDPRVPAASALGRE